MEDMIYPFSAIYKQDLVKEAILLNLINPAIGGVMIDGSCGSAKSSIIRSIGSITEKKLCEVPANVSEDRMLGNLAIDKALKSGEFVFEDGILAEADGQILIADDIHLLTDNIADILVIVLADKFISVEREGISHSYASDFLFIASVNTKFYSLRRGLSESVGLYVRMEDMNDPDDRVRIMRIRDEYDRDPEGFINNCREKDIEIKSLIEEARHRLADIRTDDEILMKISRRCLDENVQGHTADIVMKECAMAVAALHGREKIEDEDLEEAAYFVFPHRRRMSGDSEQPESSEEGEKTEEEEGSGDENEEASGSNDDKKQEAAHSSEGGEGDHAGEGRSSGSKNHAAGDAFDVIDLSHIADRKRRNLNGRRTESRTGKNSGRYIYSTIQRTNNDIALDATLRAAAPFQLKRKKNGMAVSIRDDDIREKVRQKKVANLFVFVVDASGSMGAAKRMAEAKAAVLSLLKDAYVKRDKVCMITFAGNDANVVLPPTRSVERGYRLLEKLETGGRTPLNAGLEKALRVIQNEFRQNPEIMPVLTIITDGRGNVPVDKNRKASEELIVLGEKLNKLKAVETIVIDIENSSLLSFDLARKLSNSIDARYYRLDEIKQGEMVDIVRKEY